MLPSCDAKADIRACSLVDQVAPVQTTESCGILRPIPPQRHILYDRQMIAYHDPFPFPSYFYDQSRYVCHLCHMLETHKHSDNKLEGFVGTGCLVLVVTSELAKTNTVSTCRTCKRMSTRQWNMDEESILYDRGDRQELEFIING